MRVVELSLEGHLTRTALQNALDGLESSSDAQPSVLRVDCRRMTGYEEEARRLFTQWHRGAGARFERTAVVTDRRMWHVIIRAIATVTQARLKAFNDEHSATLWLTGSASTTPPEPVAPTAGAEHSGLFEFAPERSARSSARRAALHRSTRAVVVRPYSQKIRNKAFNLLHAEGFSIDDTDIIPAGTPDEKALAQITAITDIGLLLLPYHEHRSEDHTLLSGLTIARKLDERFRDCRVPILMPVSSFSWSASAPRRIEEFRAECPSAAPCLVDVPANRLHLAEEHARLRQAIAHAEKTRRRFESSHA